MVRIISKDVGEVKDKFDKAIRHEFTLEQGNENYIKRELGLWMKKKEKNITKNIKKKKKKFEAKAEVQAKIETELKLTVSIWGPAEGFR